MRVYSIVCRNIITFSSWSICFDRKIFLSSNEFCLILCLNIFSRKIFVYDHSTSMKFSSVYLELILCYPTIHIETIEQERINLVETLIIIFSQLIEYSTKYINFSPRWTFSILEIDDEFLCITIRNDQYYSIHINTRHWIFSVNKH